MDEKIPELYATEEIPFEKKIIHQRYQNKDVGFYWLIAELDIRPDNFYFSAFS